MKLSTIIGNLTDTGESAIGIGNIDTDVSDQAGLLLTTSLSDIYAAPATAGKRYVVKSIHVTNISTASASVTAEINGTGAVNIALAYAVPIPAGSSLELLKRIKVIYPSDVIRMSASASAALHAVITVAVYDNITMFRTGLDVTTIAVTDLYVATADSAIESILITNDHATFNSKIAVMWTDGLNTVQGYYTYDLVIPPASTVEIMEAPKRIPTGHKIRVQAADANRLEVIISGQTI